jgi:hypothetical protein
VNTGEIARLELGLKYVGFETKRDGCFVGSNIAEDLKILRFETSSRDTDIRESSVCRRVRWRQLMAQYAGKIDLEAGKRFEADHFDAYLGVEHPGELDDGRVEGRGELRLELPFRGQLGYRVHLGRGHHRAVDQPGLEGLLGA